MKRKFTKSEVVLFALMTALLLSLHAVRNTSLTKQGFIREFSSNYGDRVQTQSVEEPFLTNLAWVAEQRTLLEVEYDGTYRVIPYPNGDVAKNRGVCTDVVVRSYRGVGVDLQELVHLDMKKHFFSYPKIWRKLSTDTNIDHRRVPNLMVFFQRKGAAVPITKNPLDYRPGDLVAWSFGDGLMHIGMVSTRVSEEGIPLIVHNIGRGPEMGNILFRYRIIGHFRYMPENGVANP